MPLIPALRGRGLLPFVLGVGLLASIARGDGPRGDGPRIDAQQLHLPATSSSYMALDDPGVLGHLRGQASFLVTYAHDPMLLRGTDGAVLVDGHLIRHQTALELAGSVGLLDRVEIGLAMPILLQQSGDDAAAVNDAAASLRGARGVAFGDLRLDVKASLLSHDFGPRARDDVSMSHRLRLSLAVAVTAPSASTALAGDASATGRPRLLFEWAYRRVRLGLNLGAIFRERIEVLGLSLGHQVTWGAGVRVLAGLGIEVLAEGRGAVGVAFPHGKTLHAVEAPSEIDLGLAYQASFGLRVFAAAGLGLGTGYGIPDGRFLFGARFTVPEPFVELPWVERDTDHDGLLNGVDHCANEAGPLDNDGCPDHDLDGDGVVDRHDRCPENAGPSANHGCPDYDTDGDNVPDRLDRCPDKPGSPVGAGCPIDDADGDGVPDSKDRCRDQPGSPENDGCPDVDSDGDGFVDRLDKCPFEAEVYNGVADDDGCPDVGPALTEIVLGQVGLFDPITFEKAAKGERLSAASIRTLTAVGALLRAHSELKRVRVDGHTDDRGSAIDNLELSLSRAKLVRRYLVDEMHLDVLRVLAQGFGGERPLADNATVQGRTRNRRIEITILETGR